jgi:hypothetical protein
MGGFNDWGAFFSIRIHSISDTVVRLYQRKELMTIFKKLDIGLSTSRRSVPNTTTPLGVKS